MTKFTDTYQRVTDIIVEALEKADALQKLGKEWRCPWQHTAMGGTPTSIHGHAYRGMNYILLSMLASIYPSQLFATYDQWKKRGAQVRRGEKSNVVILWKNLERINKDTGEKEKFWYIREFRVFAAEQVDGFDLAAHVASQKDKLPNKAERLETAEEIFADYCAAETLKVRFGGNRAFYSVSDDFVQMPLREQFKSTEAYYSTLAHELAHSTGAVKRLKREFGTRFGASAYAFEELIAELSASMSCAVLGIEQSPREDHAQYLASWLNVLKSDAKAIFTASTQAQKASDLILKTFAAAEEELEAEAA